MRETERRVIEEREAARKLAELKEIDRLTAERKEMARRSEAERASATKFPEQQEIEKVARNKSSPASSIPESENNAGQTQSIKMAMVAPQLSGNLDMNGKSVDPRFASLLAILRAKRSGSDFTLDEITKDILHFDTDLQRETWKGISDKAHRMRYKSAVAWAIERNGHLAWGGAWGFQRQELADDHAIESCRQKIQIQNDAGVQCRVFYRSREIDTAELVKIVDASKSDDFDAWQRALIQSILLIGKTATK
jgi:hypothetical protein